MTLTLDFTDLDLLPAARSLVRVLYWNLSAAHRLGVAFRGQKNRIVHEVMVIGKCSTVSGVPQRAAGEPEAAGPRVAPRFGSDL